MKISRLVLSLVLVLPAFAQAIIVGNSAAGLYKSVGKFGDTRATGPTGTYYATATAISNRWLLTAKHVAVGVSFPFGRFMDYRGVEYIVDQVVLDPDPNSDLALCRVMGWLVRPAELYTFTVPIGTQVRMLGVGYTGTIDGNGNVSENGSSFGVVRLGTNSWDHEQSATVDFGGGLVQSGPWRWMDFDNGTSTGNSLGVVGSSAIPTSIEATFGGGDSGGPSFIQVGTGWKICGVHSLRGTLTGGPPAPQFGSLCFDRPIVARIAWIQQTISEQPTNTSRPTTPVSPIGGINRG